MVLDPHLFDMPKWVFTILCFGHFPGEFLVGVECFSGLRIKWKRTRCGVTRDEWNVVSMTRGWNVKESRAVRLKVGLWRRKRPKWRRAFHKIYFPSFSDNKQNKQSVVELVCLVHMMDILESFFRKVNWKSSNNCFSMDFIPKRSVPEQECNSPPKHNPRFMSM